MAKDNEFIEGLQDQVIGADTLENKREELLKEIEEMESNVIKDPRALENLKKELAAVVSFYQGIKEKVESFCSKMS